MIFCRCCGEIKPDVTWSISAQMYICGACRQARLAVSPQPMADGSYAFGKAFGISDETKKLWEEHSRAMEPESVKCDVCGFDIPGGWANTGQLIPANPEASSEGEEPALCPTDYQRALKLIRELRPLPVGHTRKKP